MVDEEWDVIPDATDEAEEPQPSAGLAADDGSSPRAIVQAVFGLIVGLLTLPLIAFAFMKLVGHLIGAHTPVPFWMWSGSLIITILIEAGVGVGLRRISDVCAVTFAIAAFFSILETVGMMTEMAPLRLP